jgi:hypothetical protein
MARVPITPINEPAQMSPRKCWDKYTLEKATVHAQMKQITCINRFRLIIARQRKRANAVAE